MCRRRATRRVPWDRPRDPQRARPARRHVRIHTRGGSCACRALREERLLRPHSATRGTLRGSRARWPVAGATCGQRACARSQPSASPASAQPTPMHRPSRSRRPMRRAWGAGRPNAPPGWCLWTCPSRRAAPPPRPAPARRPRRRSAGRRAWGRGRRSGRSPGTPRGRPRPSRSAPRPANSRVSRESSVCRGSRRVRTACSQARRCHGSTRASSRQLSPASHAAACSRAACYRPGMAPRTCLARAPARGRAVGRRAPRSRRRGRPRSSPPWRLRRPGGAWRGAEDAPSGA
mmetsp:Transcript_6013/g.22773  ORF Transcript_6013/g.22773 Transcript_6013/m.22773 type:complete len:290 (-) Transcript_6013:26-895(-)